MDVAIRDAVVPKLEGRTLFQNLREIGVSAVELEWLQDGTTPHVTDADGKPYRIRNAKDAQHLRRRLDDEGVRAAALLLATDFSGDRPDAQMWWARAATDTALCVGAPVVRIDPLARDPSLHPRYVRDNFVQHVGQVLMHNRPFSLGTDVGIENHGPIANDPAWLDDVLAALPNPELGLTLDTGNFYWYGFALEEVYGLIEKYAPRAKHTHLKNINYPPDLANRRREIGYGYKEFCCPLHEGNLDLRRVVRILRDAGYDRNLCIEDESLFKRAPEHRVDVLRREVEALRRAMQEEGI